MNSNAKEIINIEEDLNANKFIVRPFKGISMLPLLDDSRDFVKLVKPTNAFKKGDVLLYKSKRDTLVLHRVINVKNNKCFIVGDNCTSGEWVNNNQVLAIMVGYYKNQDYISIDSEEYISYCNNINYDYENRKVITREESDLYVNTFIKLIYLVRKALGLYDKEIDLSNVPSKLLYFFSKNHKISGLINEQIQKSNSNNDIKAKYLEETNKVLRRTILFDNERKLIYNELDYLRIKHIPLKGIIINTLYPIYGVREFSDNDILIEENRLDDINNVMNKLGYTFITNGVVHATYHKDPIFNIEMHKKLFVKHMEGSDYLNGLINKAIRLDEDKYEYRFSPLDFYVYNLAHFKKHYTNYGAGLRSFVDQYILYNNLSNEEKNSLLSELEKANLVEFNNKILSLCKMMFEDDPNKIDRKELVYIERCGAYGTMDYYIANNVKKMGKFAYFIDRLFPPYESMKSLYPILKKIRLLLPFCWFLRLLTGILSSKTRKRVNSEFRTARKFKDEDDDE